MKKKFPAMMDALDHLASRLSLDRTYAGYPAMVLVEGGSFTPHIDKDDCPNTLCTIVALGNYEGGQLCFPHLSRAYALRPGDMITFRSHLLMHHTLDSVVGKRFALVLFAPRNLFTTVE